MTIKHYRLIMALLILSFVGILAIFSSIVLDNIIPNIIYEAEDLRSQSGKVLQDINASGGFCRFAAANESGAVVFGPYIRLPEGDYIASFRLNAPESLPSEKVATLDICTHKGKTIKNNTVIYGQDLTKHGSYQSLTLPFRSDGENDFEFRIFKDQGGYLSVDNIIISPSSISDIYKNILLKLIKAIIVIFFGLILAMQIRAVRLETGRVKSRDVFVFTLCVYVIIILVIFGQFTQILTYPHVGDEPHYLTTTYSIIHDHDIYVENNYINEDYREFFPHYIVKPHIVQTIDGRWIPSHDIGLSILLVIPYFLLGVLGVRLFLAIIAAFVVVNTFILCKEFFDDERVGLVSSLLAAFISPLLFYSYSIYPEIFAALTLVYSTRILYKSLDHQFLEIYEYILCGIMVASLPWMGIKYASLMLPLSFLLLIYNKYRTTNLIAIFIPILASSMSYAYFMLSMFGSLSPTSRYGVLFTSGVSLSKTFSVCRLLSPSRLLSYFFDQQIGLIFYAPIYILIIVGLFFLIMNIKSKSEFERTTILLLPSLCYFFMYSSSLSWGGGSPLSRPLVAILPVMVVLLGVGLIFTSRKMIKTTIDGLGVLSLGIVFILINNPEAYLQFISRRDLLTLIMDSPFVDLSIIFPSFIAKNTIYDWIYLTLWLILLVIFATGEYIYRRR